MFTVRINEYECRTITKVEFIREPEDSDYEFLVQMTGSKGEIRNYWVEDISDVVITTNESLHQSKT